MTAVAVESKVQGTCAVTAVSSDPAPQSQWYTGIRLQISAVQAAALLPLSHIAGIMAKLSLKPMVLRPGGAGSGAMNPFAQFGKGAAAKSSAAQVW
jgi:hypothetical protein